MNIHHHRDPKRTHAPLHMPGSYPVRRPRVSTYHDRTVPSIGDHNIDNGIIQIFEGYTDDGHKQWRVLGRMDDPDVTDEILTSDDL
ncbi:MAG: hypothetical protein WA908_02200 [Pontixanthobacter sp.]